MAKGSPRRTRSRVAKKPVLDTSALRLEVVDVQKEKYCSGWDVLRELRRSGLINRCADETHGRYLEANPSQVPDRLKSNEIILWGSVRHRKKDAGFLDDQRDQVVRRLVWNGQRMVGGWLSINYQIKDDRPALIV